MKKILVLSFVFLILQNCGYTPMYSLDRKVDFFIESISFDDGDKDLSEFIELNLNNYFQYNEGDNFNIYTKIDYQKNSLSKDSKGETDEYELTAYVSFIITNKNITKEFLANESFKMINFSDEFEEQEYEISIKKNMARSLVSKLIMQLSKFNAN